MLLTGYLVDAFTAAQERLDADPRHPRCSLMLGALVLTFLADARSGARWATHAAVRRRDRPSSTWPACSPLCGSRWRPS
jgi:hypothetical protein